MSKKPTNSEEDYFAREDLLKRYKLAQEQAEKRKADEAAALKAAHFMKCPKCGNDLQVIRYREVELDKCFTCNGTWLDDGELEKLAGIEEKHGVLTSIVNAFRRSKEQ